MHPIDQIYLGGTEVLGQRFNLIVVNSYRFRVSFWKVEANLPVADQPLKGMREVLPGFLLSFFELEDQLGFFNSKGTGFHSRYLDQAAQDNKCV